MLHNRDRLHFHILDPDICAALDGKDDLVDLILCPLDLHGDRAIIFIADPAGSSDTIRRVTRAIEIYRLTGRTQTEQAQLDAAQEGLFDERIFALDWPREELYRRIELRVDQMLEMGLIDEVKALMADAQAQTTARQAIGYKEIAAALEGNMSMEEAVDFLKQATRNYAKRQLTWCRRNSSIHWLRRGAADTNEKILIAAQQVLAEFDK